jgi:Flp pilus assembly protein TadG
VLRIRRRRKGEDGAAAVEFALVSIPAIILVLGALQYGWYFYVAEQTSGAASTVSRKLAVGDCWGANEALTFSQNHSAQVTAVAKTPTSITTATPRGTEITVTVTAAANIVGFFPMPNGGVVTRKVTTRLEDTAPKTPASIPC